MKILHLTPWFPRHRQDQRGNFILDSVESLAALGHEVSILFSEPWRPKAASLIRNEWHTKDFSPDYLANKFDLRYRRYLSIPRNYLNTISHWSYRKSINPILEKMIKESGCQIIHAHTELPAVAAIDIGKKLGIPVVMTVHGISTEKRLYAGKSRELLFEYTLGNADRVILVGSPLVSFSKQFVKNNDHFRIVANGFRNSEKHAEVNKKSFQQEKLRFISVSNLVEGKGVDLNIQAFAKLHSAGIINWSYKILGDGAQREKLEALTHQLNLTDKITFLGACDHNKVYAELAEADVFTLPSCPEAFGVAYVEAMSCGLLTIGVLGQGPQDFIEHQKTGLLVSPNDVDSLVECFAFIFQSLYNMEQIAEAGRHYVHDNFTWKNHAVELTKIYEELPS